MEKLSEMCFWYQQIEATLDNKIPMLCGEKWDPTRDLKVMKKNCKMWLNRNNGSHGSQGKFSEIPKCVS